MTARAIQTRYRGYRFRSRLEARWAVFFDHLEVPWHYETQGYLVDGQPYLPDFRLTDCGTWVEVKGDEDELDHDLMLTAARCLPEKGCKYARGPQLLILGPIPDAPELGDLGWVGIDVIRSWHGRVRFRDRSFACTIKRGDWQCECGCRVTGEDPRGPEDVCEHLADFAERECTAARAEAVFVDRWWGFGHYHERKSLRVLPDTSSATPVSFEGGDWLTPAVDEYADFDPKVAAAYAAARAARFEHGEKPGGKR